MLRRCFLAGSAAAGLCLLGSKPSHAKPGMLRPRNPQAEWEAFKGRFLRREGRISDTGNGGISHSESQAYGMVLAEAHADKTTFDLLLKWTLANLRKRSDKLMAWRWKPGEQPHVTDDNNATDGDILMVLALVRASERWRDKRYMEHARGIAQAVHAALVVSVAGEKVILPGAAGFQHRDLLVLNPSYHIPAALHALNKAFPSSDWRDIEEVGRELVNGCRAGFAGLPPDWVAVSKAGPGLTASLSPHNPKRFGYDAIRVPLHWVWGGWESDAVVQRVQAYWAQPGVQVAGWVHLQTGRLSPEPGSAGHLAVASLTASAATGGGVPVKVGYVSSAFDYYSAALCMLTALVAQERGWPVVSV